jgi:hypothetical protein
MHKLNISEGRGSRPELLEPHKSHLTLDRAVILFSDVVEVLDLLCFNLCVVLLPLSAVRRRNVTRFRLPLRKADGEASLAHGLRVSWRVRRSQIVAENWSEVRPRPVNVTKPLDLSSCACH